MENPEHALGLGGPGQESSSPTTQEAVGDSSLGFARISRELLRAIFIYDFSLSSNTKIVTCDTFYGWMENSPHDTFHGLM